MWGKERGVRRARLGQRSRGRGGWELRGREEASARWPPRGLPSETEGEHDDAARHSCVGVSQAAGSTAWVRALHCICRTETVWQTKQPRLRSRASTEAELLPRGDCKTATVQPVASL